VNRASPLPASRAAARLVDTRSCNCHDSKALHRRIEAAKPFVVAAIVKLADIASSPESAAAAPLTDVRKALSALECEGE
jgi:hypothetical protein